MDIQLFLGLRVIKVLKNVLVPKIEFQVHYKRLILMMTETVASNKRKNVNAFRT